MNKLLATVAIVIALASAAHSAEILDAHSPVSVVDPSNGAKFKLSPQDAAMLTRICRNDVNCIHGMAPWFAQHPTPITLRGYPLARLPQLPTGNVDDDLSRKECEFAINHHQDLTEHCGFSH